MALSPIVKLAVYHARSATNLEDMKTLSSSTLSCDRLTEGSLNALHRRHPSLLDHRPISRPQSNDQINVEQYPLQSKETISDSITIPVISARNDMFDCECSHGDNTADDIDVVADEIPNIPLRRYDRGRIVLGGRKSSWQQSFTPPSTPDEKSLTKKWHFPSIRQPTSWRVGKRDSDAKVSSVKRRSMASVSPQPPICKARIPTCPPDSPVNMLARSLMTSVMTDDSGERATGL